MIRMNKLEGLQMHGKMSVIEAEIVIILEEFYAKCCELLSQQEANKKISDIFMKVAIISEFNKNTPKKEWSEDMFKILDDIVKKAEKNEEFSQEEMLKYTD